MIGLGWLSFRSRRHAVERQGLIQHRGPGETPPGEIISPLPKALRQRVIFQQPADRDGQRVRIALLDKDARLAVLHDVG